MNFTKTSRAPIANLGLWDYREKLGLWDYTLFEIGITEIMSEFGIMGLHYEPIWDYKIPEDINSIVRLKFLYVGKLGLRDYTSFEIGIKGLHPI